MLLDHNGQECWSARDLQTLMGYERWERFEEVILRAKETIDASGLEPLDHFRGAAKVITGGRWGKQKVTDYRLTRFGAYHVALAADGRKPEVAAAKTYFAVKTREAELAEKPDVTTPEGVLALAQHYVAAAQELVNTKKELEIAKPKAGKWDALCNSDGLIELGAAAKAFYDATGLGRTKFMELLRSENIHFLQVQNPRVPYQEHVDKGRAKVRFVLAGYKTVEQTFLTPKGMDWLADRLHVGGAA
jgi:DNA-damage-inducible protein D